MAVDPYLDPVTGCLRNRLGITDPRHLAQVEARLVAAAEVELHAEQPLTGRFDLAHLQTVHRFLFGEVYDWAGQLRTVNITKGDTLFALAEHLPAQARELFARLRSQHLADLSRERFVTEVARFLADLNALHPFREGNGRTQRVFLQLLANDAGWRLAWAQLDVAENLAVSRRAMIDPDAFAPVLDRLLRPAAELPITELLLPHEPDPESPVPPSLEP